jgi:hypothetical protein
MRTIEYLALTLIIGALVIWGATAIAGSISASLNNSAALLHGSR